MKPLAVPRRVHPPPRAPRSLAGLSMTRGSTGRSGSPWRPDRCTWPAPPRAAGSRRAPAKRVPLLLATATKFRDCCPDSRVQTRFLGTELRDKDGVVGIQPEDHERDRDGVECQHEEHRRGAHEDRSLCTHTALARALCCVKSVADTGARLEHTGHCMRDEHPGTGHKQQHQQRSNVNSS